jgi:hypothetical protein
MSPLLQTIVIGALVLLFVRAGQRYAEYRNRKMRERIEPYDFGADVNWDEDFGG